MNNIPKLFCMCGLPASGKSTYAKELSNQENAIICSSDIIREELYGDINDQEHNQEVFVELHRRIRESLKNRKNVVYDATNISSKRRRAFLSELKNIQCKKECIIMATPYVDCLCRNFARDRKVPYKVISNMYKNWNTPYWFEGWDDIKIKYNDDVKFKDIEDWIENFKHYDQYNHHHTLTLGEHCKAVGELVKYDKLLYCAGLVHDCGKPFTQTFEYVNGEETFDARYFQHHCVGAYDSLFFKYPESVNALDVSIVVNLHMMPYCWENDKEHGDKIEEKFRNLWGDRLFENVTRLHIADNGTH